jgi:rod shape-determining protein MreC
MISHRLEILAVDRLRGWMLDTVSPIYSVLAHPADAIARVLADLRQIGRLSAENDRLRAEVERLERWQDAARKLDVENQSLRALLGYPVPPDVKSITGRVIADSGGAFVRTVLITVGREDGVVRGQPSVAGEGLVGRVTDVGERTARVLLVTDLNSRIPVIVEATRERAVLAGDNGGQPRLTYLRQGAIVSVGDRVVTSDDGRALPAGIPVGVIVAVGERGAVVQPYVDWARLEFVRVLAQNLGGILTTPPPTGGARGRAGR